MSTTTPRAPGLSRLPKLPEEFMLQGWDKAVFALELLELSIVKTTEPTIEQIKKKAEKVLSEAGKRTEGTVDVEDTDILPPEVDPYRQGVINGTFQGTKLAITEAFNLIEARYHSFFDIMGTETIIPQAYSLAKKQELYQWNPKGTTKYPPHLRAVPRLDSHSQTEIFNVPALAEVALLIPRLIPQNFLEKPVFAAADKIRFEVNNLTPKGYKARNMRDLFTYNKLLRDEKAEGENVGDHDDWYSDRSFSAQALVGTNPTTITVITAAPASKDQPGLLQEFIDEARAQGLGNVATLLKSTDPKLLYVQDCRYFREAMKIPTDAEIRSNNGARHPDEWRYSGASVTLYHLHASGQLHPLSIVIDYKGSMRSSVVIFNKRLQPAPANEPAPGEEIDWPWRYAKTVAQSADWLRHEVAIHLTNTHLVEEAIIVATQRTFEWNHVITRILFPHWYRTLSLNAAARDTLVPRYALVHADDSRQLTINSVILDIGAMAPDQTHNFINYSYEKFDFKKLYVPNDLESRGFPTAQLEDHKFKNYAYAKNIYPLWNIIRSFVREMILPWYPKDSSVANSQKLENWCAELRGDATGSLKGFPEKISTVDELVDVVTMCIHIASPQHTAVNYLQQYYQSFVPNKPAALSKPLPTRLSDLQKFTEQDLFDALPVSREREWLLSSHLPYLLSFRVKENQSLIAYAASLFKLYEAKSRDPENKEAGVNTIKEVAAKLYMDLRAFDGRHPTISARMDDNRYPYNVLDPDSTAVSILV